MPSLTDRLFGTHSERELKRIAPVVQQIESLRDRMMSLSDAELRAKTDYFKEQLKAGVSLDAVLPEAFAVVREADRRVLGLEPFMEQLIGGIVIHNGCIAEQLTGQGKAFPVSYPIPTPSGWKLAGEIKVGDMLFGKDGKPTKVKGVYPQGELPVYEVELKDGRVVRCAEDHLWDVYRGYKKKRTVTMKTGDMMKELKKTQAENAGSNLFHLPMASAVQYKWKKFKLDPYVLGLFIGNGCRNERGVFELSTPCETQAAFVAKTLGCVTYRRACEKTYSWHFYTQHVDCGDPKTVRLKIEDIDPDLVTLLSGTYSYERCIPQEYLFGSIYQRKSLLQGLMDSDGTIVEDVDKKRYNVAFSTTSTVLRDQYLELVYSLGYSASWGVDKDGSILPTGHTQYKVFLNIPHEDKPDVFRCGHRRDMALKAASLSPRRRNYEKIAIVDIRKTSAVEEQVCFEVEALDHLFLCGNYVVTHNTLVATLPSYLNGLTGKGVHVVTVNDYLAERDAESMGKVHRFLGLSCGCVLNRHTNPERKAAYGCDVTYVTNTELGFDYLRDHIAMDSDTIVLRGLNYCIIDEADSVLIDEARTPLIISGSGENDREIIVAADRFVKSLTRGNDMKFITKRDLMAGDVYEESGDFSVNEKDKEIALTLQGIDKAEAFFGIENYADQEHHLLQHHVQNALRANYLMHKDKDYIISADQEIMIVDEFTGRVLPGRRFSNGLHQSIEAKEEVPIKDENQTLATITYQSFFNHYKKKAGMTGTAITSMKEFRDIYSLDVIKIPPHQTVIRIDEPDYLFRSSEERDAAVSRETKESYEAGQPVLIGTKSVDESERISALLSADGIPHRVLNAKQDKEEADVIAQAGQFKAVTVATNMAGRGTDIILSDDARKAGGLYVIGTQRSESRRIDDQLVGRSGRQGDPGKSRFFLSLDDDLFRLFSTGNYLHALSSSAADENGMISNPMISRAVMAAQKNMESTHTAQRVETFRYDEVIDDQRNTFYSDRDKVLACKTMDELRPHIFKAFDQYVDRIMEESVVMNEDDEPVFVPENFTGKFGFLPFPVLFNEENTKTVEILGEFMKTELRRQYSEIEKHYSDDVLVPLAAYHLLNSADTCWQTYIDDLDDIRNNTNLQRYAQTDPYHRFKHDSAEHLDKLMAEIPGMLISGLFTALAEWEKKRRINLEIAAKGRKASATGVCIQKLDKDGNPTGEVINLQYGMNNV